MRELTDRQQKILACLDAFLGAIAKHEVVDDSILVAKIAVDLADIAGVPQTARQLVSEGYQLTNPNTFCKGCFERIGWWLTPRGIYVPFEIHQKGNVRLHYFNCPTMTVACHDRLLQYESEL